MFRRVRSSYLEGILIRSETFISEHFQHVFMFTSTPESITYLIKNGDNSDVPFLFLKLIFTVLSISRPIGCAAALKSWIGDNKSLVPIVLWHVYASSYVASSILSSVVSRSSKESEFTEIEIIIISHIFHNHVFESSKFLLVGSVVSWILRRWSDHLQRCWSMFSE